MPFSNNHEAYMLCGECERFHTEDHREMYMPQYGICKCDGVRRDRCDWCPYEERRQAVGEYAGLYDLCLACGLHERNNVAAMRILDELKIPYDREGYNGKIRFAWEHLKTIREYWNRTHERRKVELPEELPDLCTTKTVMAVLGVSNSTAYTYIRESGVPYRMSSTGNGRIMNFDRKHMQQVIDLWNRKKGLG